MRPLKLTLSAFGPFREKVEICLEKLGTSGIYLICGDTGAGKTTIFDGIEYALYGEPGGDLRRDDMLRCTHSSDETKTWAELEFLFDGKKYTVRRNPAYTRNSRRERARGSGKTKEIAAAALTLPDGSVKTGVKQVNSAIIELLGLNRDQFAQLAMIAQGKFLELLTASTDKRSELLSALLATAFYRRLQEKLKAETDLCVKACSELENRFSQNIRTVETQHEEEALALAAAAQSSPEEAAISIAALAQKAAKEKALLEEELTELEKELEALRAELQKAEAREQTEQRLLAAQKRLLQARDRLAEPAKARLYEESRAGERQALAAKISLLKAELPRYEELNERQKQLASESAKAAAKKEESDRLKKEIESAAAELERLKKELSDLRETPAVKARLEAELSATGAAKERTLALCERERELSADRAEIEKRGSLAEKAESNFKTEKTARQKALERLKAELTELREKSEALKDAEAELERTEARKNNAAAREKELTELSERVTKETRAREILAEDRKSLEAAEKLYRKENESYSTMNISFLSAQAGLLAAGLVKGSPCPVCGATEHPAPAKMPAETPTEAELKKAKKQLEKAEAGYHTVSAHCAASFQAQQSAETELLSLSMKLLQEQKPELLQEALDAALHACSLEKINAEAAALHAKKQSEEKETLIRLLPMKEKEAEEERERLRLFEADYLERAAQAASELSRLTGKAGEAEQRLREEIEKTFEHGADSCPATELKNQLTALETKLTTLNREHEEAEKKLKRSTKLEEQLPELERAKSDKEQREQKTEKERAMLLTSVAAQRAELEKQRADLSCQDGKAATKLQREQEKQLSDSEEALEEARKAEARGNLEVSKTAGEIKGLQGELEKTLPVDSEKLESLRAEKENKKRELTKLRDLASARQAANTKAAAEAHSLARSLGEAEKKRQIVEPLSRTACGTIAGKPKLMLETFVQTSYFDRILDRANLRLMKMTEAHYELARREEESAGNGKIGLELDVIDHFSGRRRSVKTLSGGESFMAALSLALGLSDEIQQKTGGVRLDTLFVDEGFGSLDENALGSALKTLCELSGAGRLTGIISHVAGLREKIEKQIEVKADRANGSSIRIITD